MKNFKCLLITCLSLILLLTSITPVLATITETSSDNQLTIYSPECPAAAIEYAKASYVSFLITAVESDSLSVGSNISLGTPFMILPAQNTTDVIDVYYFPVISDGSVIGTFRVYLDEAQTTENGRNSYSGILSPFLANELNSLATTVAGNEPALLYLDNDNLLVKANNNITLLSPSEDGYAPSGTEVSATGLESVSVLKPIDEITDAALVSPNLILRYLDLSIIETQPENNSWCMAYAAAAIIRYLDGSNSSPTAGSIMYLIYRHPTDQSTLTMNQVVTAAKFFGYNPTASSGKVDVVEQIEAKQPVFAFCDRTAASGVHKYHAIVIRGYDLNQFHYSVWNPWNNYYETMKMNPTQYVTSKGLVYDWIGTVHDW